MGSQKTLYWVVATTKKLEIREQLLKISAGSSTGYGFCVPEQLHQVSWIFCTEAGAKNLMAKLKAKKIKCRMREVS